MRPGHGLSKDSTDNGDIAFRFAHALHGESRGCLACLFRRWLAPRTAYFVYKETSRKARNKHAQPTHAATLQARIEAALAPDGLIVSSLHAAWPHTLAVYAFGSRVQGTAGAGADLDLAVLVAGYTDTVARWNVAQQLAVALGCEVDLLDMRAASTVMQYPGADDRAAACGPGNPRRLYSNASCSTRSWTSAARAPLLADIAKERNCPCPMMCCSTSSDD